MKTGYTNTTRASFVLGAGVIEADTTPIGVTRGDVTLVIEKTWQNVDFNGKGAPIVGLDYLVSVVAKLAFTMIEFGADDIARFNLSASGLVPSPTPLIPNIINTIFAYAPGYQPVGMLVARGSAGSYVDAPTYEPASTLLSKGHLVQNLRLTLQRGDDSVLRYAFDWVRVAFSQKTSPKSEGERMLQLEARLDPQGSPLSLDALPYRIETIP